MKLKLVAAISTLAILALAYAEQSDPQPTVPKPTVPKPTVPKPTVPKPTKADAQKVVEIITSDYVYFENEPGRRSAALQRK